MTDDPQTQGWIEIGDHGLWIRPRKMFQESVLVEGRRMPRFEFVGTD